MNIPVSNTLAESLGIEFLDVDKTRVTARMPVDSRTKQIAGLLHGGASAALIETLASVGSYINVDKNKEEPVGVELNISHISSAKEGWVLGTAVPIRLGNNIHTWHVEITKEGTNKIISTGRCTVYIKKTTA